MGEFPDDEKNTQETIVYLEEVHDITEDSDDEVEELSPIITRKKPKEKTPDKEVEKPGEIQEEKVEKTPEAQVEKEPDVVETEVEKPVESETKEVEIGPE